MHLRGGPLPATLLLAPLRLIAAHLAALLRNTIHQQELTTYYLLRTTYYLLLTTYYLLLTTYYLLLTAYCLLLTTYYLLLTTIHQQRLARLASRFGLLPPRLDVAQVRARP